MKHFMILAFAVLIVTACSTNDDTNTSTFDGDVLLQTQEAINAFGEEGYLKIMGNLEIRPVSNNDNIVDLSPLQSISTINGLLSISDCSVLNSINLNVVETGVLFLSNLEVNSISFPKLERVTSDFLVISDNALLTSLNFSNLKSTGSELRISNNARLENLNGFSALEHLGSNFSSGLIVSKNPKLSSFDGLSNINSDVVLLDIIDNTSLIRLDGLEHINFEVIRIFRNENLTNFCALRNAITNGAINGEAFVDNQNYNVVENANNPTVQDLKNNDCK